ncbi:MAG: rRNA maturation RNase YbeY [Candidatus Izemoplasmatales bacterium]|jgi:probable rRNA maturation factor
MLKINLVNNYDHHTPTYRKTIKMVMDAAYQTLSLTKTKLINVILVDNQAIQELNYQYRHLNLPTDVISFENTDMEEELGDIFISIDKAKEQAIEYHHTFERELGFLACHGFLHCNGYDHLNEADEKTMFALQNTIMDKIKLSR